MPFFVYIIICDGGNYYTGYTKNLENRLRLHFEGRGARYTRIFKPNQLVYSEEFESRSEAMRREQAIKRLSHIQKENLIATKKTSRFRSGNRDSS